MSRDEFIWVEKYRPKTIEECILPDNIKKTFQDFLDKGEVPNLLLSGPPGCGKTILAAATANELDGYFINVDGSSMMMTLCLAVDESDTVEAKFFALFLTVSRNRPSSDPLMT